MNSSASAVPAMKVAERQQRQSRPNENRSKESGRNESLRRADQRGQSTVEYALLLLGAAAIAMLVVAWVARTDMIGRLFELVIGRIVDQA